MGVSPGNVAGETSSYSEIVPMRTGLKTTLPPDATKLGTYRELGEIVGSFAEGKIPLLVILGALVYRNPRPSSTPRWARTPCSSKVIVAQ